MIIYCLQKYKFYYYDKLEDENVENILVLGYFNSKTFLDNAVEICKKHEINGNELRIIEYDIDLMKKQKYLYVLSYAYYTLPDDDTYNDYEYLFEPQTNKKKCLILKEKLKKNPKFMHNKNKSYEDYTIQGFFIEKFELNKLYCVLDKNETNDFKHSK